MRDLNGEYSEEAVLDFEVYNPDMPEILNTQTPRSPLEGTVQFYYTLSDPDAGETAYLTPSFFISGDGVTWEPLGQKITNTGMFELNTIELEDGTYQLKIRVADPILTDQFTEYIYPEVEINNPDPPSVTFVGYPLPGTNNTGEISLSWDGSDPDGDTIRYYLYYSDASITSWIPITEAQGITAGSFIWNTSSMTSGDYILKLEARDGSKADLKAEVQVQSFHVHVPEADDSDGTGGDKDVTSSGSGDDNTLLILLVVGMMVIIILVALGSVAVILKGRSAQASLQQQMAVPPPPPGTGLGPAQGGAQLQPPAGQGQQLPPPSPEQLPPGGPPSKPPQNYIPPAAPPMN